MIRFDASQWKPPPPIIQNGKLLHLPNSAARRRKVIPIRPEPSPRATSQPLPMTRAFDCPCCGFTVDGSTFITQSDGKVICPNNECGISFDPPIA